MSSFRFVLSCSITPLLLIVGVVVEQNHQSIQDDYYEATADNMVIPECKANWTKKGKYTKQQFENSSYRTDQDKKGETFAKENFGNMATKQNDVAKALKAFLFDEEKNYGIPQLFKNKKLVVGDGSCNKSENWEIIKHDVNDEHDCTDCGYVPGANITKDIVDFASNLSKKTVSNDVVPKIWCHNPLPVAPFKSKEWRGTGGYYNVLKCTTSPYSVIGFAGEVPDTCYPYHTHKSYELYWTIGGKADWKAPDSSESFDSYTMNGNTHYLHKHDPMKTHEIVTKTLHTTQIYFWSMVENDKFSSATNNYNVDTKRVTFQPSGHSGESFSESEKNVSGNKSCFREKFEMPVAWLRY